MGSGEADDGAGWAAPHLGSGFLAARPELWERLSRSVRVTAVAAPAGSGKTVLLRSWILQEDLAGRAAWVSAERDEQDPQRFWLSVVGALRQTAAGAGLVRAVSAAPDLDGWAVTERLLTDLAPLTERLWLVIDDLHELGAETLRQLDLLIMRATPQLRFVFASRHDVRLRLHRLRLEGELAEINAQDLKLTVAQAGDLFAAAGTRLPGPAVAVLHERTEGWAAGLRLAALAAAGHPDPARFAAEFSGTERTVAEYLLAEVLDRQDERVRRLLLRTSILQRVNGELADLLTGDEGAERALQDLESENAFVVSLDGNRSWFRYHQLFAGLLQMELRRTAPGEVAGLHQAASAWFAGHQHPVEAIRHAQAARNWDAAARLLADHWPGLYLDGQSAIVHELLAGFPAEVHAADAELAVLAATDKLTSGSLETSERYLALAERGAVPDARRGQFQVLFGVARVLHARQSGNPKAVREETRRLEAAAGPPETGQPYLGADLRALALISLGSAETWTTRFDEAPRHLEQGIALAGQVGRPFLEFSGLANLAIAEFAGPAAGPGEPGRSYARIDEHCARAIELAQRHGWTRKPAAGTAYRTLGAVLAWQGRTRQAEPWIQRAERTMTLETEPAAAIGIWFARGVQELARGRYQDALEAFRIIEDLAGRLEVPDLIVPRARAFQSLALTRLGDSQRAEQVLADLEAAFRERGDVRIATAGVRLARSDPQEAAAALAPVLAGATSMLPWNWLDHAFLLEAIARDMLGDQVAAERALERALDLADLDGALLWFLLHPAPDLLERHARQCSAHAALIDEICGLLAGPGSGPRSSVASPRGEPGSLGEATRLTEPLSESELRVLRYLPTNLSAPEIAGELYVSPNTIKTHMRRLYAKLGTHSRAEAVIRARSLSLLAPSAREVRLSSA